MASISVSSTTSSSITVYITANSGTYYYKLFYRPTSTSTAQEISLGSHSSSFSRTISGLSSSTTYAITVGVYSDSGYSTLVDSDSTSGTTDAPSFSPTVTIESATSSTIEIKSTVNSSMAPYYRVFWRKDGESTSQDSGFMEKSGSSFTYTITGLESNTLYYITVGAYSSNSGSSSSVVGTGSASATTDAITVVKWSWTASNGNATATQTSAAYSAVTGQGFLTDFSYLVWNDLCDKISEVRQAAGHSAWNSTLYDCTLAQTKMTSSDKEMTAKRFNSARANIGYYHSTGISEVSTGDIIYGSYFTTLSSKLNEWIDEL